MKTIPLSAGFEAIVDDEDFEYLSRFKWNVRVVKNTQYAKRSDRHSKPMTIQMHREIMKCPKNLMVDHINGNGLDNRKENLRVCTRSNNLMNSKKPDALATSKYKGVHKIKLKNPAWKCWRSEIRLDKVSIYVGLFATEKEAALAYNKAAIEYFGEYAKLNKVEE